MQTNFAYGSTPYLTWRRVMQSPRVAAALAAAITLQPLPLQDEARASEPGASDAGGVVQQEGSGEGDSREQDGPGEAGAGGEYLVLGSSVGWMVLFAAATYGVPSRFGTRHAGSERCGGARGGWRAWRGRAGPLLPLVLLLLLLHACASCP